MKRRLLVMATFVVMSTVALLATDVLAQGPTGKGARRTAFALGTGFTYQGQLKSGSGVVNGTCDLQAGLWDDGSLGAQQGVTQTVTVNVTSGLFTTVLNGSGEFGGSAFDGSARWLAMAVRCPNGSGSYTGLGPRRRRRPPSVDEILRVDC